GEIDRKLVQPKRRKHMGESLGVRYGQKPLLVIANSGDDGRVWAQFPRDSCCNQDANKPAAFCLPAPRWRKHDRAGDISVCWCGSVAHACRTIECGCCMAPNGTATP